MRYLFTVITRDDLSPPEVNIILGTRFQVHKGTSDEIYSDFLLQQARSGELVNTDSMHA